METLLDTGGYTIQTASGCGLVLASAIVGEIGDINRFTSPGALAKYAGCAPRERSSGKKVRHVKSRSGNRRLNCAFHRMALSQISRMGNDKSPRVFQAEDIRGQEQEPSTRLPPPANGEHCLDDAEAQNSLPKCLTFPHSGSSCGREISRGRANPFPQTNCFALPRPH